MVWPFPPWRALAHLLLWPHHEATRRAMEGRQAGHEPHPLPRKTPNHHAVQWRALALRPCFHTRIVTNSSSTQKGPVVYHLLGWLSPQALPRDTMLPRALKGLLFANRTNNPSAGNRVINRYITAGYQKMYYATLSSAPLPSKIGLAARLAGTTPCYLTPHATESNLLRDFTYLATLSTTNCPSAHLFAP